MKWISHQILNTPTNYVKDDSMFLYKYSCKVSSNLYSPPVECYTTLIAHLIIIISLFKKKSVMYRDGDKIFLSGVTDDSSEIISVDTLTDKKV